MDVRRLSAGAVYLLGMVLLTGCSTAPPPTLVMLAPADEHVLSSISQQLVAEIGRTACIGSATGLDLPEERRARTQRQNELTRWYDGFGRDISIEKMRTATDRANLASLGKDLAGMELLMLPLGERRRLLGTTIHALNEIQLAFPRNLTALTADEPAALALIEQRLTAPLQLEARWFPRGAHTTFGAVYVPGRSAIYVNIDQLAKGPAQLIDTLTHELWHHLLPVAVPPDLASQPWVEGFTEAVAEWNESGGSIEYPIQTAYASLYLATGQRATIRHLSGLTKGPEFADELSATPGLANTLGLQMARWSQMPPERIAATNRLLNDWGWREDDGSPMDITRFILNGELIGQALNREFLKDRLFAMDLMRALSVLNIAELQAERPADMAAARSMMPRSLARNLDDVLTYCRRPTRNFLPAR